MKGGRCGECKENRGPDVDGVVQFTMGLIFSLHLFVYFVCACVFIAQHYVEVRGQLWGVGSLRSPCGL